MAEEVLRERRGHVEILTINRPEARNAINRATAVALGEALDDCASDDDVWVVVLTAAGDKAFSAGMDLKAFASGEFPSTDQGFGGITQRDFPKPLIAAANGSALAGGFEIMISCDMVIAADHAKFGIPEASRGLVAAAGGLIRLPKLVPLAVAYELALTADPTDAVVMIGSPAGSHGVINRAKTIDTSATDLKNHVSRRGHSNPRNAAGTAASRPHDAGLPSALAPSAPSIVKRFQNRNTPDPVSQKPARIASVPREACERATPVDSSMVRCAATSRRSPLTRTSGAI